MDLVFPDCISQSNELKKMALKLGKLDFAEDNA